MQYINCKQYAQEILDEVKAIPNKKGLTIITVGNDPASEVYVRGKIKDAEYCGIPVNHIKIDSEDRTADGIAIIDAIVEANANPEVAGIILQLPLPSDIPDYQYVEAIVEEKDVDGLGSNSLHKPCTPKGIMYLLEKELGDLTGKSALVIGRSDLVGKPLAKMLLDANCTVTVAHSKSDRNDIRKQMLDAEIVISAVGKPEEFDPWFCFDAEIVIDVGINRDVNGNLVGDFNVSGLDELAAFKMTPVPGGVGLMTRAMLMKNVAEASELL